MVDNKLTTAYRLHANGECKRYTRTLVTMLSRAVQRRPYDREPLYASVLQSDRSTVSEATGFTPCRFAFGRKMRLPVDLGMPLPEPPRDLRTFASELAEDLEWSYRIT